jgi:TAZ zinc finger.
MNERDRYYRFTRARSASPLPSQTAMINRKYTKLKNGPSPTSVMGYTFDFDEDKAEDEPFDCSVSTRKRASSVGNLERMNGPMVPSSPSRLSVHLSSSLNTRQVARRSPFRHRPPVPNMPPMSPRQSGTYHARTSAPAPLSPGEKSVSKMASNFRQRRLLLSNRRHWNDDRRGRSVDTKLGQKKRGINDRSSIDEGLDLSMGASLDRMEMPQFRTRDSDFPIQAARINIVPSDEDMQSTKDNASHYCDFQEECDDAITIDTVSSLNTMQTEDAFHKSNYHASNLTAVVASGSPKWKYGKRMETPLALQSPPDDVHPPMYVRSKVRISSVTQDFNEKQDDDIDREMASPTTDSRIMSSSTLSADRSNQSKKSPRAMLEDTDIVSNKARRRLLYDNDIPAVFPQSAKHPTPSPLRQKAPPEEPSHVGERSATYLRRERLQKLRMARHNSKASVGSALSYTSKQSKKNATGTTIGDKGDSNLKHPKDGTEIIIFKKPPTPPKELDRSRADPDDYDTDIDTNLYEYAKEREEEDDDRSVKTGRSLQSFHTLKTCFTVKPANKQELQKAIAVKQGRINLIHHALTCTHPYPVNANDDNYMPCPEVKHCHALGVLVRHVQTCTFNDPTGVSLCEVPGCALYKKVWNHYRRCVLRTVTTKTERKTCRICGDVWRKYAFDLENSF